MKAKPFTLTMMLACSLAVGCKDDARQIWKAAISKCAKSDLLGSKIIYFGPSNKYGPGQTFAKLSRGAIQPSYALTNYTSDTAKVLGVGETFTCGVTNRYTNSLLASIDFTKLLSVSNAVSAQLQGARNIDVKAASLQWVDLLAGPYFEMVSQLPDGNPIKLALVSKREMVMSRALKVSGMEAKLQFSKDNFLKLKATIPQTVTALAGTGVEFEAKTQGEDTLVLTSKGDFFIAGELRYYDKQFGLSSATKPEVGPQVDNAAKLHIFEKK